MLRKGINVLILVLSKSPASHGLPKYTLMEAPGNFQQRVS